MGTVPSARTEAPKREDIRPIVIVVIALLILVIAVTRLRPGQQASSPGRTPPLAYWTGVLVLLACGGLAIFSVGFPFFVLGAALAALRAAGAGRRVFWAVVAAIVSFFVAYIVVAPLRCSASSSSTGGTSLPVGVQQTRCTNLLGIDYSGRGRYNPPLWPALLAGLVAATAIGVGTSVALRSPPRP